MKAATKAMAATPPTTPPAMAPVWDVLCVGTGLLDADDGLVVVGEGVVVVDGVVAGVVGDVVDGVVEMIGIGGGVPATVMTAPAWEKQPSEVSGTIPPVRT